MSHTAESILKTLKQIDVLIHQGKTVPEACRSLKISDTTFYKWRKEYGGMGVSQLKRLKDLERENGRLKKVVADLTVDKLILQEAVSGK